MIKKTTLLLHTCSITSCHSESESAQMETTMSQSCYCLWNEEKTPYLTMSVLYHCLPQGGGKVFRQRLCKSCLASICFSQPCSFRFWMMMGVKGGSVEAFFGHIYFFVIFLHTNQKTSLQMICFPKEAWCQTCSMKFVILLQRHTLNPTISFLLIFVSKQTVNCLIFKKHLLDMGGHLHFLVL